MTLHGGILYSHEEPVFRKNKLKHTGQAAVRMVASEVWESLMQPYAIDAKGLRTAPSWCGQSTADAIGILPRIIFHRGTSFGLQNKRVA